MTKKAAESVYTMSPSQLETWLTCNRKWAWRYISGIQAEAHPSAAKGSKVHGILERYLLGGEMPPVSSPNSIERECALIAMTGLKNIPEPMSEGLSVESRFKFESPLGHNWMGIRDFVVDPEHNGGVPLIGDHKTTSNFRWAKTETVLRGDAQAILYAKSALLQWPESKEVELRWVYYQTQGTKKSKKVSLRVISDEVEKRFRELDSAALGPVGAHAAKVDPLSLPYNVSACDMYGGCPYKTHCNIQSNERLKGALESMSLLEKMKSNNNQVESMSPLLSLLKPVQTDTIPAPPPQDEESVKINPPEFQEAPTAQDLEDEKEAKKAKKAKPKAEKKAKLEPIEEPILLSFVDTHVEQYYDLYIDCLPIGEAVTPLEKYLDVAREVIRENSPDKLADYRFASYGQGPGMLCSAMSDLLDRSIVFGNILLRTNQPEANVVEALLVARARRVVRGM